MPLPQGYTLDGPAAAGPPKLPAGYTLDQPSASSRFWSNYAEKLNPFPALKHELLDKPAQELQDITSKLSSGDYGGAASTLIKAAAPIDIDRTKEQLKAQGDQFVKAYQNLKDPTFVNNSDRFTSAGSHVLAGLLPGIGPAAAQAGEQIGSGDVAGGLGSGAGLITGVVAPALAARGTGAALRRLPAAANVTADALRASAEKNIETALNPTTKVNKALVQNKLAPGILDRGITATSLQDLQDKAQAGMEQHGQVIDDIFDQHANAGTKLSPKGILDKLEAEKQDYVVDGEKINPAYVDKLQSMQDQIQRVADTNEGDIPLASLRRIKQIQDEVVAKSKGGFALSPDDQSVVAAHKVYGNAIRSTFADSVPELADPSREFSFNADLDKVVGDSLLRKTGQRAPLTQKFGEMAGTYIGAHAGPVAAVVGGKIGGALGSLQNSTIWNTLSAAMKVRVADLISSGDAGGAMLLLSKGEKGLVPPVSADPVRDAQTLAQSKEVYGNQSASTTAGQGTAGQVEPLPVANGTGAGAGPETAGGQRSADTTIEVPGSTGKGYKARYTLKELADLQASHNGQTFQPNPRYQLTNDRDYANAVNQGKIVAGASSIEFKPALHITDNADATNGPIITDSVGNVYGGNGRKMMLDRVYAGNPKGVQAYRDLLTQKAAQFGIDPAQVASMKRPVLTREIPDSEFIGPNARQKAVTDFNRVGTAPLRPPERAIADSQRVSSATLDHIGAKLDEHGANATVADVLQGKPGGDILDKLVDDGVVSPQERTAFQKENGELTAAGKDRVSSLMVGRFFTDPAQLDTIAPTIRNQVERIAAPLAQVEAKPGWSLTPHVKQALDIVEQAQKLKIKSLDDFLRSDGLFGAQKYAPEAVTLARALKTMSAGELKAAARQYAQDAAYASKGANTLMGDAPTPASSFGDAFGAAKAPANALAQKKTLNGEAGPANALAPKKSRVESENSRQYDRPRLSGNRNEPYLLNGSDLDHLQRANFERVPLSAEDERNAVAQVTNLSGFEYISRMTGEPENSALGNLHGHHFSPDQLPGLIKNLEIDHQDMQGVSTPGLQQLLGAAEEARAAGKSLIIVKDHQSAPDDLRARTLNEEINHAAQRAATGSLRQHLGGSAQGFVQGRLGSRAVQYLEKGLGYSFRSLAEAATEVGARLMEPNRYQELGLGRSEARALASEYVQRLETEYGAAKVRGIARRINEAF